MLKDAEFMKNIRREERLLNGAGMESASGCLMRCNGNFRSISSKQSKQKPRHGIRQRLLLLSVY